MNVLSNSEIASMAMTASGSTAKNFPITPVTKNIGMNAMIVVVTEVATEGSTSRVPSTAAWTKPFPRSRCA